METQLEYWKRYRNWLRLQLGQAKSEDVKQEIRYSIVRANSRIDYEESLTIKTE